MFYIGVDSSRFQFVSQWFCYADVVYSPSFILQSYRRKTLAPPCVVMRFFIKMTEGVYISIVEPFIHPCAFFRQETAALFIAYRVVDVYLFVADIVVAANDEVGACFP